MIVGKIDRPHVLRRKRKHSRRKLALMMKTDQVQDRGEKESRKDKERVSLTKLPYLIKEETRNERNSAATDDLRLI